MDTLQAYQVLHLSPGSSFSEIKYAYRKLALELHPDKNYDEQDGAKFKMITEAYHLLKNTSKSTNSKARATAKAARPSPSNWGVRHGKTPEEDWSRYTKDVEDADPVFWKRYVAEFWKAYEEGQGHQKKAYDFEITQDKEPDLFVDVDQSLCIGCCSCETIAPSVFSVDKISKMNPKSKVINRVGAKCEKILDAAQTCPTKAIRVEDEDTGRRLYPY